MRCEVIIIMHVFWLQDMTSPNPLAKAQLDLLSKLIGGEERSKSARSEIRLNLFNSAEEEE